LNRSPLAGFVPLGDTTKSITLSKRQHKAILQSHHSELLGI